MRAQLDAAGKVAGGLAVLADAHVAGGHTLHDAVLDEDFGGGEARINFHTRFLRLLAEPAHHVAERDDVVAVVVHLRRRGKLVGFLLGEERKSVFRDRYRERDQAGVAFRKQFFQRPRLQDAA